MSTRYLIAALLMTSACVAHADVTSATPASSAFLSNWTTGNGASVVGSGVLSNNASLIGGVAHGSDPNLVQALYAKASANAGQAGAPVKIAYSQGIAGDYLTTTNNAILVAMLGDSLSAVSSPDGAIITNAGQASGDVGNPGGGAIAGGGAAAGSAGGGGSVSYAGGVSGTGSTGTSTGAAGSLDSGLLSDAPTLPGTQASDPQSGAGSVSGSGAQSAPANLPEPSSLALLAAGLLGTVSLRRRSRR